MSSSIKLHSIKLQGVAQSFTRQSGFAKATRKDQSDVQEVNLFKQLALNIEQGQSYAITGPSGAGKSSLLMIASGLEKPSEGQVHYMINDSAHSLSSMRENIGYIFQQFHLLPELTALNNVALPLKLRGDKNALNKAQRCLAQVGLAHRVDHMPDELSGGEQQRVAIARALVFNPKFIFADEPTGNLDRESAAEVTDLLFHCCQHNNAGLVIVTHSETLASKADHQYALSNGELTAKNTVNSARQISSISQSA